MPGTKRAAPEATAQMEKSGKRKASVIREASITKLDDDGQVVPFEQMVGTLLPKRQDAKTKSVRRNLMFMWNDRELWTELDRFMIALHRFQTDPVGRVRYRQLLGMHGGGGGTSNEKFEKILRGKMEKDLKTHYNGKFPDSFYWPEPVPNAPYPEQQREAHPFTYTFCWHSEPQFIIWHRALTAEFECLLQDWVPEKAENRQDNNEQPLGLPYWAWENWDGQTLPIQVTMEDYTVRTNDWKDYIAGNKFSNPLRRWFAPVSLEDQKKQVFPAQLTDANCTLRSPAFVDASIPHEMPWDIQSRPGRPAMSEVVSRAMAEPDFLLFATVKPGSGGTYWSIENAHNKFHNHIGGFTMGGVQGPGKQKSPLPSDPADYFTGTMAQNQSIFDPIFWLHHSNIERHLCSWKRIWIDRGRPRPSSVPPQDVMDTVLFPWTKPEKVAMKQFSWNTPSGEDSDATFADWWNFQPTYEYDQYVVPTVDVESPMRPVSFLMVPSARQRQPKRVRAVAILENRVRGGEFTLHYKNRQVASISVLSGWGTGCARCASRPLSIDFDVSHIIQEIPPKGQLDSVYGDLALKKNDMPVQVKQWTFSEF
ncbi:hypothetical protein HDU85_002714 [Gaertneriomyces sp. JEL0708]|nr:hypothetical protein HDU85_002714 [Gaertneriomyces sp. JEL0708]